MLYLYRAELLKLRRTKIYWAVWLLAALGNLVSLVFMLSSGDIKDAFYQQGTLIMFLAPFLFAVVAGYIFSKEYGDRTINQLFTYPVSRTRIFTVKLLVIFTMIVMTFVLACFSVIVLGALKVFAGEIPSELFLHGLTMNAIACALSFCTIPVAAAVTIVGKNIVPPTVLGAFASFVTLGLKLGRQDMMVVLSPWATPYYMVREFDISKFVQTGEANPYVGTGLITLALTFVISLVFCLWYYNKSEIHSGS